MYGVKTLAIFNGISGYVVDIMYNYLYIAARDRFIKLKQTPSNANNSLTDVYMMIVREFIGGLQKNKESYIKVIRGIHKAFQEHANDSTILLETVIDRILEQFVPMDYLSNMTNQNRDFMMHKIIVDIFSIFANQATNSVKIAQLIDDHKNRENTQIWVNDVIDIQIIIREKISHQLTKSASGASGRSIPIEVVENLKRRLVDLLKEKCEIENRYEKANLIIGKITELAENMGKENELLEKQVRDLRDQLTQAKMELTKLYSSGNIGGGAIAQPTTSLHTQVSSYDRQEWEKHKTADQQWSGISKYTDSASDAKITEIEDHAPRRSRTRQRSNIDDHADIETTLKDNADNSEDKTSDSTKIRDDGDIDNVNEHNVYHDLDDPFAEKYEKESTSPGQELF